jgi:hypothetical protein
VASQLAPPPPKPLGPVAVEPSGDGAGDVW